MLVAAMSFTLAACGSSTEVEIPENTEDFEYELSVAAKEAVDEIGPENIKIYVIMKSSDEFQNSVVDGARAAGLTAGIPARNIRNTAPTNESDTMQQVTAIEDAISAGASIILNSCQEENACSRVLQQAADKGVKVVMVDTDCTIFDDKVTYIGTDNYDGAYEGATEFAKTLEPGSNVVILRGKLGDVNHEARTEGLSDALEDAGMNVLEVQDANCETDKAANTMEAFIAKYPDQIDAVMVTSDSMAVGAAHAIESAGLEGIKVCGFDGFQSAISLIPSGGITMVIAQRPFQIGWMAVDSALGSMAGYEYDSYLNPGIQIIDESNYQDYLD